MREMLHQNPTKCLAKKAAKHTHEHIHTQVRKTIGGLSKRTMPSSFLQSGSGHLLFTVMSKRLKIS